MGFVVRGVFGMGRREVGRWWMLPVGLLDAETGARAEGWLEWWWRRISYEELRFNKGLVRSLETGLRGWGEQISG